jgi:hypothetical protein
VRSSDLRTTCSFFNNVLAGHLVFSNALIFLNARFYFPVRG